MNQSLLLFSPPSLLVDLDLLCNSAKDVARLFEGMTTVPTNNNINTTARTVMDMPLLVSPFPEVFGCDYSSHGITVTTTTTTATTAERVTMSLMETPWTMGPLYDYFLLDTTVANTTHNNVIASTSAGLTLELWMTSTWYKNEAPESLQSLPIVTIGRPGNHSSSWSSWSSSSLEGTVEDDFIGCSGYDLLVAQRGDLLEVSYQDNDVAQSCRFLLIPKPLVEDALLQVILIFRRGYVCATIFQWLCFFLPTVFSSSPLRLVYMCISMAVKLEFISMDNQ
jgi:hypothetical protein